MHETRASKIAAESGMVGGLIHQRLVVALRTGLPKTVQLIHQLKAKGCKFRERIIFIQVF